MAEDVASTPDPRQSTIDNLVRLARATQVPPKPGLPGGYSTINSALASSTRVPQFAPRADQTPPTDRGLD